MAFRAALLLHMLRCDQKPANKTDAELAAIADQTVSDALGGESVN
jgi:hypothetical protein